MHELNWRIDRIFKRKNRENKFQADLHGIKLEYKGNESIKQRALTEDEDKALKASMEMAQKRIKERYGRRPSN